MAAWEVCTVSLPLIQEVRDFCLLTLGGLDKLNEAKCVGFRGCLALGPENIKGPPDLKAGPPTPVPAKPAEPPNNLKSSVKYDPEI